MRLGYMRVAGPTPPPALAQQGAAVRSGQLQPALVFVHGYNTSFHKAVAQAAQLRMALRLTGPVVAFSWPSRGSPRLSAYSADATASQQSLDNFYSVLEQLVDAVSRL